MVLTLGLFASSHGESTPGTAPTATPKPLGVLFRAHFVGTTQLAADTNATPWTTLGASPASQALFQQTLQKLALAPHQLFRNRIGGATNDYSTIFQTLFSDLVRAESFAEFVGNTNAINEIELAVRLPEARVEFWNTNLLRIVESWSGVRGEPLSGGGKGWQVKEQSGTALFRFAHSGSWTVLGWGTAALPGQEEILKRIKQSGSPDHFQEGQWLTLWLDLPNWPVFVPQVALFTNFPALDLRLLGRGGNLRTTGELVFHEPLRWVPQKWLLPTNVIRDPLISFTAAQGMSGNLRALANVLGLKVRTVPDQFFLWAQAGEPPMFNYGAAPVSKASGLLRELGPQLEARYNPALHKSKAGRLAFIETNSVLFWYNIPFLGPTARPMQLNGREYLTFGLMPITESLRQSPPPELFAEISGSRDLVYYDWEITAVRTRQWWGLWDLAQLMFNEPRLSTNKTVVDWLVATSTNAANTVTKVSFVRQNRLSFVRSAPVGLTGFELVALGNLVGSPGFPLFGYGLPSRTSASDVRSVPNKAK